MYTSRTLSLAASAIRSANVIAAEQDTERTTEEVIGDTHGDGNVRVKRFVNNVTEEAHATQRAIDRTTQEFVFNPPRTCGVRMRVSF